MFYLYAGHDALLHDRYVVIWKRVDGKWYLFIDIFNTNTPPSS